MRFLDLFPMKGTYQPGEALQFKAVVSSEDEQKIIIELDFFHLEQKVGIIRQRFDLCPGKNELLLTWSDPMDAPTAYGVRAKVENQDGVVVDVAGSAVDSLNHWTAFPRYGFLSKFPPNYEEMAGIMETMVKFHVNGLQFYDWQYRHDQLLSPNETYIDPLERTLSLSTIENLIGAAHDRGIAAMPYLAVYAASLDFWREHLPWSLYNAQGEALTFVDFLGLMDPTWDRPWIQHLTNECASVLEALPFDGLHIDQYGAHFGDPSDEPIDVFDIQGQPVDIPQAFSDFLRTLRNNHPTAALTFNAVGNWPIEALAGTDQDFVYIEVWPPNTQYWDLVQIVRNARELSGGKAVVIALYVPAQRMANVLLADALIFSCGGSRIEIGDGDRLLSDPYFPKSDKLGAPLDETIRGYSDFAVRYQALIGPAAGENRHIEVETAGGIWHITRSCPGYLTVSLVNFSGIDHPHWNVQHPRPQPVRDLLIRVKGLDMVSEVYWSSADDQNQNLKTIEWQSGKQGVVVNLPKLHFWAIIVFQFDG